MKSEDFTTPIRLLAVSLLIFGLLYQGSLMAIGQVAFSHTASGSPVVEDGQVVGSEVIGQQFRPNTAGNDELYFWSRPSAIDYNAMTSGSHNWGPTNPGIPDRVRDDLRNYSQYEHPNEPVPADLVAESGSGYDAHISPAAAQWQVPRVANQTGISEQRLNEMIEESTTGPWLGIWGHERVNVLELNIKIKEELEQQNASDQESQLTTSRTNEVSH